VAFFPYCMWISPSQNQFGVNDISCQNIYRMCVNQRTALRLLESNFTNPMLFLYIDSLIYPSEQFFIVSSVLAIIFVEIVLWSGRNGCRTDAIFVATAYGKSANQSDLSIKTTKNTKFCIIISALRKKL
jgi:hypothetical protein